jgi:signal transduction histidine kinase
MFIAEGTFFFFMVALGGVLIVRTIRLEVGVVRQQANFINAITHELKSPLATMRLYIETLQRREVDPETRARYVGTLRAECDRLETLVGHVLTLSRLEARRQGPAEAQAMAGPWASRIDLGAETEAVVQARLSERGEQASMVRVERPDGPLWAQMDVASWHTIVRNLVDNACKYGEGRPVQVRVSSVGPSIEVSVHDSGIGMAAHELDRVLGAFYRVGDEMVRRSEGSGLGLYLTQALLAEFAGEVRVASAGLGQGATFTAVVPREQARQKEPT